MFIDQLVDSVHQDPNFEFSPCRAINMCIHHYRGR